MPALEPAPSPAAAPIGLRPLSPALGVEVTGVDLSRPFDAATAARLRALWREHALLLFRGQEVSADDQNRLAGLFGTVVVRERNRTGREREDVQHVSNARADGILGEGRISFHSDQLFFDPPLTGLALYAIEVPASGGETRFCNTSLAYARMPAELKARIAGRRARHVYDYDEAVAARWNMVTADADAPEAVHPILWTDPEIGRHGLWVNPLQTVEVLGLGPAEGKALMDEIRAAIFDEAIIYTHQWRPMDLIIWDNRVLQHARRPFDTSQRRTLRRTSFV